jgi:hypothetical protein
MMVKAARSLRCFSINAQMGSAAGPAGWDVDLSVGGGLRLGPRRAAVAVPCASFPVRAGSFLCCRAATRLLFLRRNLAFRFTSSST